MASFVRSLSYVCNYVCYLQRQLCTVMYSSYVDVDFYEEHCGTITFITIPVSTSISVCTDRTMARRVNYIYSSSILVCIRGGGAYLPKNNINIGNNIHVSGHVSPYVRLRFLVIGAR